MHRILPTIAEEPGSVVVLYLSRGADNCMVASSNPTLRNVIRDESAPLSCGHTELVIK